MKSLPCRLALALALATTALTPVVTVPAWADVATSPNPLAVSFGQATSDIPADPAAHFGRLSNGMTYVIYKNGTPPGTVSGLLVFAGLAQCLLN